MKTLFVTSGFPDGFTADFFVQLCQYLPKAGRFVMVASDFSAHEKSARYLAKYLQDFGKGGIYFSQSALVDFSVSPKEAVSLLKEADIVWLSGGPTLTQIRHIKEYGLIDALQKRDGVTVGTSAGSINMAKQVLLARDPDDGIDQMCQYEGIGLVDFSIEPHFADAERTRMPDIQEAMRYATRDFYGLYDGSFIVESQGKRTFFGPYRQLNP